MVMQKDQFWPTWNEVRNSATLYAKVCIAEQALRDVTRAFEDFGNDMEADAREVLNTVRGIKETYVEQCEARKKAAGE
jgi:hypothetical protein